MKISEMSTESFANVVAVAGDSLANIMQNEAFTKLFEQENPSPIRFAFSVAKVLCGSCRDDVFAVLGAISNQPAETIAKQNILRTAAMLRDIYNDIKAAEIPE